MTLQLEKSPSNTISVDCEWVEIQDMTVLCINIFTYPSGSTTSLTRLTTPRHEVHYSNSSKGVVTLAETLSTLTLVATLSLRLLISK